MCLLVAYDIVPMQNVAFGALAGRKIFAFQLCLDAVKYENKFYNHDAYLKPVCFAHIVQVLVFRCGKLRPYVCFFYKGLTKRMKTTSNIFSQYKKTRCNTLCESDTLDLLWQDEPMFCFMQNVHDWMREDDKCMLCLNDLCISDVSAGKLI